MQVTPSTGAIYRFGLDWSDPQPFSLPSTLNTFGPYVTAITRVPRNGSFWLSTSVYVGAVFIVNFTLADEVLGLFTVDAPGATPSSKTALAFDPADHTLWLASSGVHEFQLHQLEATADERVVIEEHEPLASVVFDGSTIGGVEFAYVPEPTTASLLAAGLVPLLAAARRRDRAARSPRASARSGHL